MALVIETQELCKSYSLGGERIPVLRNLNIAIAPKEFVSIMGPSGSGKSTLLNILGCLDKPSCGRYFLDGHPVDRLSEEQLAGIRNHKIGFIFQNFNLLPKLDLWSNIELPLIYGNVPRGERRELVESSLQRLGIWERRHHRPSEISGGQKQRAAIARALVKRPAIILADEPTGNLDSHTTAEILHLLQDLNNEGNTILVITHEHDVAARTQRVLHLVDGAIESKP